MSLQFGIIGKPLSHSFSPKYFAEKFEREGIEATYEKFELESIEEFTALIQQYPNLKGLNVTIPYKTAVMPYLDSIDETAKAIGAVNCIKIENGKTIGYNTDVIGFEQSLQPLLEAHHTSALILGDGGAAQAVKYALKNLNISYNSVVRSGRNVNNMITYSELTNDFIHNNFIIINTTPLGMSPNVNEKPALPYHGLTDSHILYDLIYNPIQTLFLKMGELNNTKTKNGLEMLHLQAEAGWQIWIN